MRHFAVNLPAGVTMTKTRDVQHAVTFCHHWLHLWLMSISYLDLCVGEDDKLTQSHTHMVKQGAAVDTVLHVLSEINISFALLLCLDADWHPFLRGQLMDMHTHVYSASGHTPTRTHALTHSEALRAVVCLDWRFSRAVLTSRWHSIPFRRTSLFTNYSEQNAACFRVYAPLYKCVLDASGLSLLHTNLVLLLDHCLHI